MAKRSFITGVNGQDGAYLAQLLLKNGHSVVGAVRNVPTANLGRLQELGIAADVEVVDFELQEFGNALRVIERARVDEVYNLAGQSYVGPSFDKPVHTGQVNAIGVTAILEAIRTLGASIRFYQASTSELFGKALETPQTERTPFYPRSPYAAAKAYAQWITVNYRESYGMHAVCGILFNHESPLRAQGFVTRKITLGLAQIRHKKLDVLELGNLDARRDWGFAGDYVDGMCRMLQHEPATDYVLATGETRSIRDFVVETGRHLGFDLVWQGTGIDERGIDRASGRTIVKVNPQFFRPAEVDIVCGDASKARRELGWQPHTSFSEMVRLMVEADDRRVREGRLLF
ncbi:MAG: GDP-mannose 4,6-dehydratase [Xanthobacteraceae bacterium]|nr:GDP-mannose 4,6-dehydratase [Xanthobacteraceae bacterium]